MGNFIRPLSERVSYIASDDTWIESNAIQQLNTTASLPDMVQVVGMPDLHPGRGYPVGAAFFSVNRFYPALVGNDIGCGMGLWQTTIPTRRPNLDKLEKSVSRMGDFASSEWLQQHLSEEMMQSPFADALGSVGGGNHFAELQQVDQIYQSDAVNQLGLNPQQLQLLVHSGSRGLGQAILRRHVERFNHGGLMAGTPEAEEYLNDHHQALLFAKFNRRLIAQRLLEQIKTTGECLLDINHNLVEAAQVNGTDGWLHRKGASPANRGPLIIPGSRGDYSYLVMPTASDISLHSLAHGAGRKWIRTECKGRLSERFSPVQLSRTEFGGRVICQDRQLIYEEAPQAYKSIETVIDSMAGAGLIKILARLKPVLTYKTSGGRSE
ncbi:RNA ligase RtcB family protein [Budviciaceae bacterium BWR-B9]|uniref:RNA ligase RtcB family protein n=1 Tax=Limnobaculum allomyrinae TaxID=2791986 RepID=A0ABS1IM80_9GAMM|nr:MULTISPECIES: RNA ligase RtcB family protein [Limnobaculum]MBK5142854.1 RNA ligase RtcB family protein [Limnobaculum allomyrinae]MBV7690259.1 RNA ligase RtcB family protein [Limnobaculum sp. M2-1]